MSNSAHLQSMDRALVSTESADGGQQATTCTGNAPTHQSTSIGLVVPADGSLAGGHTGSAQQLPHEDQSTVASGPQATAQEPGCDQSLPSSDTSPMLEPSTSFSLQSHTQHEQEPGTLSTSFTRRRVQTTNTGTQSGNIHHNLVTVSTLIGSTLTVPQEPSPAPRIPIHTQQDQEQSTQPTTYGRRPIQTTYAASRFGNIHHNVVAVASALSGSPLNGPQEESVHENSIYDEHCTTDTQLLSTADNLTSDPNNKGARSENGLSLATVHTVLAPAVHDRAHVEISPRPTTSHTIDSAQYHNAEPEHTRVAAPPFTPPKRHNSHTARLQNIENRSRNAAHNADPMYEHSIGIAFGGRALAPVRPAPPQQQRDPTITLADAVAAAEIRERAAERREKNDAAGSSPVRRRYRRPRGGGGGPVL